MKRFLTMLPLALTLVSLGGCKEDDVDVSGQEQGDSCEPDNGQDECGEGFVCAPLGDEDGHVCGVPYEIRGQVVDALDEAPVAGALVIGLDDTGAPVTDVAETNADGRYTLQVPVPRNSDGSPVDENTFTLQASAADYAPYPGGVRPAFPVSTADAIDEEDAGGVIENAATTIALIPLEGQAGVGTIRGRVAADSPAGALLVADGGETPAPWALSDAAGNFTIFNVPEGTVDVVGYLAFEQLQPVSVDVDSDAVVDDVVLEPTGDDTATVTGSVNIVNAPGGSQTSVVLIPSLVFEEVFEQGAVPLGLRAPEPGIQANVTSAFEIEGVPQGSYKVLAAFENDGLVRDPDTTIAGTEIVEIDVGVGGVMDTGESFKITEALEVFGPGADGPEVVSDTPVFRFADDSSETRYVVVVHDALGNEVWRDDDVPEGSGSEPVEVTYAGPELTAGMYYRFQATSWKDTGGSAALSRTEDLRGVFVWQP